uniref:DExD/H-box helicase 60 n=1 Tax=Amazona collaria TaxID=241587 RepID=A0A8B9GNU6_9PSIT
DSTFHISRRGQEMQQESQKYVSLLKDFVESEFFVIDGDSLLLMFLDEKTQYLNFFYQIECFLQDFTEKGAKYVIAFFKDAEQMYFQYPCFLFLRTALIEHLRHNTSITVHTEFSNCLSSQWELFLKKSYPYFIIVSDIGLSSLQTDYLSILIAHSLSKKINVVLTSGQEYDILRVYGYHVQSVYKHRLFFAKVSYTTSLSACNNSPKLGTLPYPEVHQSVHLLKKLWPEGSDIRRVLCVLACAVGLKVYSNVMWSTFLCVISQQGRSKPLYPEEAADLCRMQCLAVTFLLRVPLSQRAQIRIMKSCWTKQVLPLIKMVYVLSNTNDWKLDLTYLPDLNDDSLLINLAYYYEVEYNTVTSLTKYKEFDELRHWHSGRPLTEEYERVACTADAKSKDPAERRQIQKLQAFHQFFGSTLEDSTSKLIVLQEDASGSANAAKSKAEIIAEENNRRLRAKEEKKEEEQWKALCAQTEKEIKADMTVGINKLEKLLKKLKSKSVKFSVEMTGLSVCLEVWKEHCRTQGNEDKDLGKAVQVMRRIHILLEKYQDMLEKPHLEKLTKCLRYLGFENLACSLSGKAGESNDKKISNYAIKVGPARFQLQYMDYYLLREERHDPDPRVQRFIPDTWQRELLDAVDNNESAVIVAPTSSGKTYASYYCMEKVLKASNEGVVVYVAPTKALVNQVVGTIYSRFTKKLPDGLVLCGVFTRDYRHDIVNSQILVTVPQCLEILMLSPRCQKWAKRIQYVIFDEVHCLGGEIGAEVWEHLLVTIRCPFLALSATVSNPEHLTAWLQSVKRYWQRRFYLFTVLYEERYNDLEKYVCSLKSRDFLIEHCHPCAALTVNHIENYGIPSDLSLSPRESIQLYDTMVKVWQAWPRAQELDPEAFVSFKNKVVIKKADVRKYEQELKKELSKWIALGQRQKVTVIGHFLMVLMYIICFYRFNVDTVESAAKNVFLYLLKKQSLIQGSDVEKERNRLSAELQKVNKMVGKFNPEKIFYRLRFERRGYLHRRLALRGIGYHHASMASKERQVVEMLFRMGYIKVVTATSSLALGINMPCKSVVFAEDSVFLDALNYRQMSGRAGRRGYDMIGNVFFYDIPMPKVERLMKSNVPELKGQFPLTISLILRLMLLAAKADDKQDAKAKALSVLKHSLMSFRKERYAQILKIYFMFSLQFLIKEGYLDQEGKPMGFAGLVTHLHYHEPSNFVLVSFLEKGLFHKLCQPIKGSTVFSEGVLEKLVLILANLFGRKYLPACSVKYKRTFCQSKVFLEDLPEDFAEAVNEYNTKAEENFAHFLLTTAKLADMEQEYRLPLSKTDFTSKSWHGSELVSYLTDTTKSVSAVSPFACVSGMIDDDLFLGKNINKAVLRSLGINVTNCPLLYLKKYDNQGRRQPLNAYALDFYKHGSLIALTTDNWLNEGDAYYALKEFVLIIKSIGTSLSELCDDPNDNVLLAFQQLGKIYAEKLDCIT